jgi:pantetheine-phosphate adenylyltransferase
MKLEHAIYPGSFDPFTKGHADVLSQAADIAHNVDVVIAHNPNKDHMFTAQQRVDIAARSCADKNFSEQVNVQSHEGVTSRYINEHDIDALIRGIRNGDDLRYESELEVFFKETTDAQTIYLTPDSEHVKTSSTVVRRFIKAGYPEKAASYMDISVDELEYMLKNK